MHRLTPREREIALLVCTTGLSNKYICRQLNLSEGTVKIHLHNIYGKLAIRNRTQLAVFAAGAGCNIPAVDGVRVIGHAGHPD